MKPKKRQKLCYNCDGGIDLDVIVCPFCAADLREAPPEKSPLESAPSATVHKESLKPLYPAPEEEYLMEEPIEEIPSSSFWPLGVFLIGTQLLFFGLFLLLFSENGALTLHWNASYWPFYLLIAVPSIVFGYRKL